MWINLKASGNQFVSSPYYARVHENSGLDHLF